MANKEKVQIKRSDQFQEVDEELSRAMADLDSTIERVSEILQSGAADGPEPGADPVEAVTVVSGAAAGADSAKDASQAPRAESNRPSPPDSGPQR